MIQQDQVFYKQLLKLLMVQGLIRLFENKVRIRYLSSFIIRCLERDINLVKEVIGPAKREFLEILKKELDIDFECEVWWFNSDKQIEVDEFKTLIERDLSDNSTLSVADYNENEGKSEVNKYNISRSSIKLKMIKSASEAYYWHRWMGWLFVKTLLTFVRTCVSKNRYPISEQLYFRLQNDQHNI